jgi:hypothetical protein
MSSSRCLAAFARLEGQRLPDELRLLREHLRDMGFQVRFAFRCRLGQARLSRYRPTLLIPLQATTPRLSQLFPNAS